ncbi:MAG: hypothetical protein J5741_03370 [Bacteroidales bacterium]|nr:hypothetical protein [Bacteroidales bacterium]
MQSAENQERKSLWGSWKNFKIRTRLFIVAMMLFAIAGAAILGAWGVYKLGLTNDRGAVDDNNRYLANYKQHSMGDSLDVKQNDLKNYLQIAALSKFYPSNAEKILMAKNSSERADAADRMLYAAKMYLSETDKGAQYDKMCQELMQVYDRYAVTQDRENLIPWMNDSAWPVLKQAILKDKDAILDAARITGVEPRLIVGCLVGEQIRLFNSKREMYKRYLGPVKVLSVQSQFSFGVTGVKDYTAMLVEKHLTDTASPYYMGKAYEHILDFETADHATERYNRLVNYRNHLFSYIYTGCILHQTMLQWKRAGYDISDRPDILFTLFNLGFEVSKPKENPQCGGSRIRVGDREYTFGVIGSDFYFSGELTDEFPIQQKSFADV